MHMHNFQSISLVIRGLQISKYDLTVYTCSFSLVLLSVYVDDYLRQGDYAFGSTGLIVCLPVCLSSSNITQKVMNRLQC